MMRPRAFAFVFCGLAVLGGIGILLIRRGFSARDEPTLLERVVARAMRNLAIPRHAAEEPSPWKATPDTLREAREAFVARCAICHGPDGSGETTVGRNLYPRPPDL